MQDYVKKLAENEFGPVQAFTRGEAVNLLSKIFKFLSANDDPGFADVDKTHIYYDAIASAAAAGMISGDGNSDFRPDAPITKEDFLTMVSRGIQTTKMRFFCRVICRRKLDIKHRKRGALVTRRDNLNGDP